MVSEYYPDNRRNAKVSHYDRQDTYTPCNIYGSKSFRLIHILFLGSYLLFVNECFPIVSNACVKEEFISFSVHMVVNLVEYRSAQLLGEYIHIILASVEITCVHFTNRLHSKEIVKSRKRLCRFLSFGCIYRLPVLILNILFHCHFAYHISHGERQAVINCLSP